MTVYLIHFDPPYKHAKHYIGFTTSKTADRRISEHMDGNGSRLTKIAVANGTRLILAHVWPEASRDFERKLKNRADVKKWCPLCEKKNKLPEYSK